MITAINARLAGLLTAAAIVVAAVLYVSSLSRRLEAAQEQLRSEVSRAEAAEAGAALMAERLSELIADKEAAQAAHLEMLRRIEEAEDVCLERPLPAELLDK